ncbi:helix-turn-helix domain-containing protein [Paracoccus yeei]|uniref:helix-turn-helix domain-containing protein n=1 Tax=Paracoccus yeei TaxID=147645 RepID=UPI003BF84F39
MSVKIMSAVFESETLGPTERLIMLALADHADDAGRCYPSLSRLQQRTGLSERAIQSNIRNLQSAGYITIIPGAGQGGANVYIVRPNPAADAPPQQMHPRRKCTTPPQEVRPNPAADAPPQQMHPRRKCTTPPQEVRPTPAADAPKPSGTIIEPSESNGARDALLTVLSAEAADAFIDHRRAKRAKLTVRAAQLIVKDLTHHPNPDAVVEASIKNGWTGVFPEKIGGPRDQSPRFRRETAASDALARRLDAAARTH